MLQPSVISFLRQLQKNNNKAWFDIHRPQYENAKADFTAFTSEMIDAFSKVDNSLSHLQPRDCMFRINRDVRFSKDKRPYKNNMAAYFNKNGKKGLGAGYYLHIEPGKSFVAGGIWMPEPKVLAQIRQEIDYNYAEWKKIITNTAFKKNFPEGLSQENILSRPPKGYDESNPAIGSLKLKSFIVTRNISDEETAKKDIVKNTVKIMAAMQPLVEFINRAAE